MTNGSSQGLFVVVAVVIFGVFVAISYSLFRDTLTPSLASIFQDSLITTSNKVGYTPLKDLHPLHVTSLKLNDGEYSLISDGSGILTKGLYINDDFEIPYGYKYTLYFEIYSDEDTYAQIDYNTKQFPEGKLDFCYYFQDCYNNQENSNGNTYPVVNNNNIDHKIAPIEKNKWVEISGSYENTSPLNKQKRPLKDFSYIGIAHENEYKEIHFKIRNVQYKLEKIGRGG